MVDIDHRIVERPSNIQTAEVKIRLGTGELHLKGGSAHFLEAQFSYNNPDWKPLLEYWATEGRGKVEIRQPSTLRGMLSGGTRYEWDLAFSNEVLIDLDVNLGAGRGDLKLGGMLLGHVELQMGAGDISVDLRGNWTRDLNIRLESGIGRSTVLLPPSVGVLADVSRGLCSINASGLMVDGNRYRNAAYGQSPVTIRLNVQKGVGEINLRVAE